MKQWIAVILIAVCLFTAVSCAPTVPTPDPEPAPDARAYTNEVDAVTFYTAFAQVFDLLDDDRLKQDFEQTLTLFETNTSFQEYDGHPVFEIVKDTQTDRTVRYDMTAGIATEASKVNTRETSPQAANASEVRSQTTYIQEAHTYLEIDECYGSYIREDGHRESVYQKARGAAMTYVQPIYDTVLLRALLTDNSSGELLNGDIEQMYNGATLHYYIDADRYTVTYTKQTIRNDCQPIDTDLYSLSGVCDETETRTIVFQFEIVDGRPNLYRKETHERVREYDAQTKTLIDQCVYVMQFDFVDVQIPMPDISTYRERS